MAEKIVMDGSDEILVDVMGKHDIGVKQFPQMIRLFAQTVHSVNHLYEISTAAKAVLKT